MSARELDLFEFVAMQATRIPDELFTKPDDDWTPVMFMECKDGSRPIIPLEPYMGNEAEKEVLANVLMPSLIAHFEAIKVVMVLSCWTAQVASLEELEPIRYVRPSQRENREEVLLLTEYTRDGVSRFSMAPIIRHEDSPPTLGEWGEETAEGSSLGSEGRFVTPIIHALKQVSA